MSEEGYESIIEQAGLRGIDGYVTERPDGWHEAKAVYVRTGSQVALGTAREYDQAMMLLEAGLGSILSHCEHISPAAHIHAHAV